MYICIKIDMLPGSTLALNGENEYDNCACNALLHATNYPFVFHERLTRAVL